MRTPLLLLTSLTGCVYTVALTPPTTDTGSTSTPTSTPVAVEDRILQLGASEVDVLFVVQSTGDGVAQAQLVENFPYYMDYFLGSDVDHHIGVVTTDLADGGVLRDLSGLAWIDADTPDPLGTFASLADVGTAGSTVVQPLGTAWTALEVEAQGANVGFLRESSSVQIVVVGDGVDDTDPAVITTDGFVAWFEGLRADPALRSFGCLVPGLVAQTECGAVAAELGGFEGDANDPAAYEELGMRARTLARAFPLSATPVPGSLEVTVELPEGITLAFEEATLDPYGNPVEGDWIYDPAAGTVTFVAYVPDVGSTVVMRYTTR